MQNTSHSGIFAHLTTFVIGNANRDYTFTDSCKFVCVLKAHFSSNDGCGSVHLKSFFFFAFFFLLLNFQHLCYEVNKSSSFLEILYSILSFSVCIQWIRHKLYSADKLFA